MVDFGPGAGRDGGRIVVTGSPEQVAAHPASLTGKYLSGKVSFPQPPHREVNGKLIVIRGARHHNLKISTSAFWYVGRYHGASDRKIVIDAGYLRQGCPPTVSRAPLPGVTIPRRVGVPRPVITMDQSAIGRSPARTPRPIRTLLPHPRNLRQLHLKPGAMLQPRHTRSMFPVGIANSVEAVSLFPCISCPKCKYAPSLLGAATPAMCGVKYKDQSSRCDRPSLTTNLPGASSRSRLKVMVEVD
jgi:hypothetical protein